MPAVTGSDGIAVAYRPGMNNSKLPFTSSNLTNLTSAELARVCGGGWGGDFTTKGEFLNKLHAGYTVGYGGALIPPVKP
jgi:hypothetical protein